MVHFVVKLRLVVCFLLGVAIVEFLDHIGQPVFFGKIASILPVGLIRLMLKSFFFQQETDRFSILHLNAELERRVSIFVYIVYIGTSIDKLPCHFEIFLDQPMHQNC